MHNLLSLKKSLFTSEHRIKSLQYQCLDGCDEYTWHFFIYGSELNVAKFHLTFFPDTELIMVSLTVNNWLQSIGMVYETELKNWVDDTLLNKVKFPTGVC